MRPLATLVLVLATFSLPARADVAATIENHILPGTATFAAASAALAEASAETCETAALRAPFDAAWDAWLAIAHLRLGPGEVEGRALAIAFWPDPKGQGLRAQIDLMRGDPARLAPAAFAEQSVAARGLTGLERLLFQPDAFPGDTCPLIRATAADLARMAAAIDADWRGGFAELLRTAGAEGNDRFLSEAEARQALYTQLDAGLGFLIDQRLGRPMGEPDRPRPERAEARASERSARNLAVSIRALQDLAQALVPEATRPAATLDAAARAARALPDPAFADAATPEGRLRLEAIRTMLIRAREQAARDIGGALGVGVGFNSADGD